MGRQNPGKYRKRFSEQFKLGVNLDTNGLEGPGCGVYVAANRYLADHARQLLRRRERTVGYDRPSYRPGFRFLAVFTNNPLKITLRHCVYDVGGGSTLGLVHAHIEFSIRTETKSSLRVVKLW